MGVLSTEIVELILGRQWLEAGPVFAILAVAAFLQPVGATVGWIYTSLGQTRRMFFWVCMAAPIIVLSFLLGLPWGAIGVASSYALCNCILIVPLLAFALKYTPVTVRDVFSVISRPLAMSIAVGLAMSLARAHLVKFTLIVTIPVSIAVGVITFWLLARSVSPVWRDTSDIVATVRLVLAHKE
jgi:PST family polysaccharide transporter